MGAMIGDHIYLVFNQMRSELPRLIGKNISLARINTSSSYLKDCPIYWKHISKKIL